MRQVSGHFLADPKVRQRKYFADLSFLVAAYANESGDFPARSFSRVQVATFRDKLLAVGVSPARVNRYLSAKRRCWYRAIDIGFALPTSPWPRKAAIEEPTRTDVLATPEEVAHLFAERDKVSAEFGTLAVS